MKRNYPRCWLPVTIAGIMVEFLNLSHMSPFVALWNSAWSKFTSTRCATYRDCTVLQLVVKWKALGSWTSSFIVIKIDGSIEIRKQTLCMEIICLQGILSISHRSFICTTIHFIRPLLLLVVRPLRATTASFELSVFHLYMNNLLQMQAIQQ